MRNGPVALEQDGHSVAPRMKTVRPSISAVRPNQGGFHAGPVKDFQVIELTVVVVFDFKVGEM